jgi:hypothetical protein
MACGPGESGIHRPPAVSKELDHLRAPTPSELLGKAIVLD